MEGDSQVIASKAARGEAFDLMHAVRIQLRLFAALAGGANTEGAVGMDDVGVFLWSLHDQLEKAETALRQSNNLV